MMDDGPKTCKCAISCKAYDGSWIMDDGLYIMID